MKIFHITNWYPNQRDPDKAIWIKKQIESLSLNCDNHVFHFEIKKGIPGFFAGKNENGSRFLIIHLPFEIWRLNEILSLLVILKSILNIRNKNFDLINFHIAYPNCTYIHIIKKYIKCPIVITEHWSGYHFNFNIRKPEKRKRIQRIFQQNIPVIAVSKALLTDIKSFSQADFPGYVVPNVVDTSIFKYQGKIQSPESMSFFMVSQWKWPKDPFTVLKAWEKVIKAYPEAKLRIGGYGPQYNDIRGLIAELDLGQKVKLIGLLTSEQIASEMHQARAFIHCSEYETFSVVCAEALCCGTPVIASRVGGIPEYIREEDGILVPENTPEAFYIHITKFLEREEFFVRSDISKKMIDKFAETTVEKIYYSAVTEIISNWNYGTKKY